MHPRPVEPLPPPLAPPTSADVVGEWAERAAWAGGVGLGAALVLQLGALAFTASAVVLIVALLVRRVTEPISESTEGTARSWLRESLEDLWDNEAATGYGVVTLARFLQLEVQTLWAELQGAGSLPDFVRGEAFEVLIGFSIRSLFNSIEAALWPIDVIRGYGWVGILGIMVGYAAWDRFHDWVDDRIDRAREEQRALEAGAQTLEAGDDLL